MKKSIIFIFGSLFLLSFKNGFNNNGQKLFFANCAMCHRPDKPAVGPPFQHIRKDYDTGWIYSMIQNHDSFSTSNDIKAHYVHVIWNETRFGETFHSLSNKDIKDILDYVDSSGTYNAQHYEHRKLSTNEMGMILSGFDSISAKNGPLPALDYLDSLKKH